MMCDIGYIYDMYEIYISYMINDVYDICAIYFFEISRIHDIYDIPRGPSDLIFEIRLGSLGRGRSQRQGPHSRESLLEFQ